MARRVDAVLAAILVLALALRLWGVTNRLPDPALADIPTDDTAVDEGDRRAMEHAWTMWYGGTKPLDLNPHTGDWPGLPFYLTLGAQVAYRANDLTKHPGGGAEFFRGRMEADPGKIFLAGRLLGVVIGVASIVLIYFLGLEVGGLGVARFAAALLTVLPFHVFSSQRISDPNLLCLAFTLAASIFMIRAIRSESVRESILAGVFVGLGTASKYVPVVLLAPLALSHVRWDRTARPPVAVRWTGLAAGVLAAIVSFLITSPFSVLDPSLIRDMRAQQTRLTSEWTGISSESGSLVTYLVRTLPEMLTWPGYIMAVLGCMLLWKRGREGRILVLVAAATILAVSVMGMARPRFVFPAVGSLIVATAVAVFWIRDQTVKRAGPRLATPGWISVPSVAIAGFMIWGLATAAATQSEMSKTDARHAAHAAVAHWVPAHELVALDTYGPVLRRGADGRRAVVWPFAAARVVSIQSAFDPAWLDGVRYYMTSSEVTSRYAGNDPRDARERAFYEWIRTHGSKVWGTAPPEVFGPSIDLYRLPEAISTRAERESLWTRELATGPMAPRMERWTAELSEEFLLGEDPGRAEEWAARGLTLPRLLPKYHQKLFETRALALVHLGRSAEAERVALHGRERFPSSPLLPVIRGMALEELGEHLHAAEEYRLAIPISPEGPARTYLIGKIKTLESVPR